MASQSKKLSRKYKSVPWIKTKHSLRYRKCLAISRFRMCSTMSAIAASGAMRIAAIKAAEAFDEFGKVHKALQIANTVIKTNQALLQASKELAPYLVCIK